MVRAGKLRHRLKIEKKTVTRDTFGEEVITYTEVATVWGSVEPLSGSEYFAARQTQSSVSHRVRMRYIEGIDAEYRITLGDRVFEIDSVINPQERNAELVLMVTE